MEKFAEHIIETDRRAREIIDQAQKKQKKMLADADKKVELRRQEREDEMAKKIAAADEGVEAARQVQQQKAHDDYIRVKHELDVRFNRHHDKWVQDCVDHIIDAL